MTLRTLTLVKEARYALVYFAVDDTFSVLETKKTRTEDNAPKIRGSMVNVKIGDDDFEGKIIELNGKKFMKK